MPTAGWPSAATAATTSPIREAPSSIEYSVWRCRWTNESRLLNRRAPLPSPTGRAHGPLSTPPGDRAVDNYTAVIHQTYATNRPGVDRCPSAGAGRGQQRHVHLV